MSIHIAPSILASDLANLADEVKKVEAAGADSLHIDVMDGCFVPNLTFGMPVIKSLRKVTRLPLDVHLMIVEPERHIEAFAAAGADLITVHAEACTHLERTLDQIQQTGCRAGVAFNPATPIDCIKYVMHRLDLVLIMTVNPGFGGQSLIEQVLPKISDLRTYLEDARRSIDIQVDGGVNKSTVSSVVKAGANVLVAGSAIFSAPQQEYKQRITELRTLATG
mgnify:CR=1 FL=1